MPRSLTTIILGDLGLPISHGRYELLSLSQSSLAGREQRRRAQVSLRAVKNINQARTTSSRRVSLAVGIEYSGNSKRFSKLAGTRPDPGPKRKEGKRREICLRRYRVPRSFPFRPVTAALSSATGRDIGIVRLCPNLGDPRDTRCVSLERLERDEKYATAVSAARIDNAPAYRGVIPIFATLIRLWQPASPNGDPVV
ncbi:hypothetical protein KM043_004351 [Ampulex compressa]|nr:hypothetical protein KM043_004351 [Ampulex compressa]